MAFTDELGALIQLLSRGRSARPVAYGPPEGAIRTAVPVRGSRPNAAGLIAALAQAVGAGRGGSPGGALRTNDPNYPTYVAGTPTPGVGIGGPMAAPEDDWAPQGIVYGYRNGQTFYDTPGGRLGYRAAGATPASLNPIVAELARRLRQSRLGRGRSQRAGLGD